MKIDNADQGSTEWMLSRLGKPTCSKYDSLLTPKTLKPAAARELYLAELLASYLLGQPIDWGTSQWTERGTEMEEEARKWYEWDQDVDVERVGFISTDDGLTGGSPDGLVNTENPGGAEIKCLGAAKHMLMVLDEERARKEHVGQVQGCMFVTDREWWDLVFFNPSLPRAIYRVARDPKWVAAFKPVLQEFTAKLEAAKAKWEHARNLHPEHPIIQAELRRSEASRLSTAP